MSKSAHARTLRCCWPRACRTEPNRKAVAHRARRAPIRFGSLDRAQESHAAWVFSGLTILILPSAAGTAASSVERFPGMLWAVGSDRLLTAEQVLAVLLGDRPPATRFFQLQERDRLAGMALARHEWRRRRLGSRRNDPQFFEWLLERRPQSEPGNLSRHSRAGKHLPGFIA